MKLPKLPFGNRISLGAAALLLSGCPAGQSKEAKVDTPTQKDAGIAAVTGGVLSEQPSPSLGAVSQPVELTAVSQSTATGKAGEQVVVGSTKTSLEVLELKTAAGEKVETGTAVVTIQGPTPPKPASGTDSKSPADQTAASAVTTTTVAELPSIAVKPNTAYTVAIYPDAETPKNQANAIVTMEVVTPAAMPEVKVAVDGQAYAIQVDPSGNPSQTEYAIYVVSEKLTGYLNQTTGEIVADTPQWQPLAEHAAAPAPETAPAPASATSAPEGAVLAPEPVPTLATATSAPEGAAPALEPATAAAASEGAASTEAKNTAAVVTSDATLPLPQERPSAPVEASSQELAPIPDAKAETPKQSLTAQAPGEAAAIATSVVSEAGTADAAPSSLAREAPRVSAETVVDQATGVATIVVTELPSSETLAVTIVARNRDGAETQPATASTKTAEPLETREPSAGAAPLERILGSELAQLVAADPELKADVLAAKVDETKSLIAQELETNLLGSEVVLAASRKQLDELRSAEAMLSPAEEEVEAELVEEPVVESENDANVASLPESAKQQKKLEAAQRRAALLAAKAEQKALKLAAKAEQKTAKQAAEAEEKAKKLAAKEATKAAEEEEKAKKLAAKEAKKAENAAALEKEKAEKLAAKEAQKAEKLAAEEKVKAERAAAEAKEKAEKLAAKEAQKAERLAAEEKEKAEKLAAKEAQKAERLAAEEKEKAEKLAAKEAQKAEKLAAKEAKAAEKAEGGKKGEQAKD